jgi:hypothetical protein
MSSYWGGELVYTFQQHRYLLSSKMHCRHLLVHNITFLNRRKVRTYIYLAKGGGGVEL